MFGGPSRRAFHGVPRILPGTGDHSIGLEGGRFNVTLRESGLTDNELSGGAKGSHVSRPVPTENQP